MKKPDYVVVIPSKARVDSIPRMLSLLPDAVYWVDEREAADYEPALPKGQLECHGPTTCIVEVVNDLLSHFSKKYGCVVMMDDDLNRVSCLVGRSVRYIREPLAIRRIIENAMQVCIDLGLRAFGWNRNPNPMQFLGHDPLSVNPPLAGAYGIIGEPLLADKRLISRGEDIDISMQYLVADRIAFSDRRFYFDFGAMYSGTGGNQGTRRMEDEDRDTKLLKQKWGKYLEIGMKSAGTVPRMAIQVRRRSPMANYT